jgi:hypothetical protein
MMTMDIILLLKAGVYIESFERGAFLRIYV